MRLCGGQSPGFRPFGPSGLTSGGVKAPGGVTVRDLNEFTDYRPG